MDSAQLFAIAKAHLAAADATTSEYGEAARTCAVALFEFEGRSAASGSICMRRCLALLGADQRAARRPLKGVIRFLDRQAKLARKCRRQESTRKRNALRSFGTASATWWVQRRLAVKHAKADAPPRSVSPGLSPYKGFGARVPLHG